VNVDERGRTKAEGFLDELTNGLKEELQQEDDDGDDVDDIDGDDDGADDGEEEKEASEIERTSIESDAQSKVQKEIGRDSQRKSHGNPKERRKSTHTKHTVSLPTVPILDQPTDQCADDSIDLDYLDGDDGTEDASDWMDAEDFRSLDEKELPNESHRSTAIEAKDDAVSRKEERKKETFRSTAPLEDILSTLDASDTRKRKHKTTERRSSRTARVTSSSSPMGDIVTGMLERAMEERKDTSSQQMDADVYDEVCFIPDIVV
jgi:hypothetical protein